MTFIIITTKEQTLFVPCDDDCEWKKLEEEKKINNELVFPKEEIGLISQSWGSRLIISNQ